MTAALATMVGAASPRNLPKAIETQLQLQRERPEDPKVANDLGNLLVLAERPDEAKVAYQRAIELAPGDAVPLYNLGLLQQRQGRPKEALSTFKAAVELDPANAWARYQLGALYESLDDKTKAVAAYSRAFALNPELASADTNPQVIDSKWVIEAMLQGYRAAARQPLAPQAYDDPTRIAMLMISYPEARATGEGGQGEGSLAEGSEPSGGGATPGQGRSERSGAPVVSESGEPGAAEPQAPSQGSRKVLTSDTIERGGALGQVGAAGAPSRSTARRTPTATRRQSTSYTAPRRDSTTTDGTSLNSGGRSTGSLRYQPSARSTGSLDLELVPAPEMVTPAG